MKNEDITGMRFGRLTALHRVQTDVRSRAMWLCECDCGSKKLIRRDSLLSGNTTSCGCFGKEARLKANTTHGETNSRVYRIYYDMKTRCSCKSHKNYPNYGGRNITICKEWLGKDGVSNFIKWAKENGYSDNLSLDRIDNNKGYSPDNCRWATIKQQVNNKRTNRLFEYNGETHTIAEWAETFGVDYPWFRYWLLKIGIEEVVKVINGEKMVRSRVKKRAV